MWLTPFHTPHVVVVCVGMQVEVSMVEIYNESVRDLLADPSATKAQGTQNNTLDIRQGEQGVYVQGKPPTPSPSSPGP